MAYISTIELKRYLGIESSNTADDTLLGEICTRAQTTIERLTGRKFECAADTTHYLDRRYIDQRVLYFDDDICQITSIVSNGATMDPAYWFAMPRNTTPYHAVQLRPQSLAIWVAITTDIQVTGRWAYSITPPDDIKHAAIRLAAWLYRQKDNTADLDRALVIGNSTILPAKMPSDIAELLYPYRRITV